MKQNFIILSFCFLFVGSLHAQIKGKIIDKTGMEPIEYAHVFIKDSPIGVMSNTDGDFLINIPEAYKGKAVIVSCIGYLPDTIHFPYPSGLITIALKQTEIQLSDVVVKPMDPVDILRKAIRHIPVNYPTGPVQFMAYYRELVNTDGHFVKYADAACNIYYNGYHVDTDKEKSNTNFYKLDDTKWGGGNPFPQARYNAPHSNDAVQIIECRKSNDLENFINNWDFEKGLKKFHIGGGPLTVTTADIVKSRNDFLDSTTWKYYRFKFEGFTELNNHEVYQISFTPKAKTEKALWEGLMFIDKETYAFVKFEYSASPKCVHYLRQYNTELVVELKGKDQKKLKKRFVKRSVEQIGQRIRVDYMNFGNTWYLSHVDIENTFINEGDLFDPVHYVTYLELYVNDIRTKDVTPFHSDSVYYTNKFHFLYQHPCVYNPSFWETYNTPVPSDLFKRALVDLEKDDTLLNQFQDGH